MIRTFGRKTAALAMALGIGVFAWVAWAAEESVHRGYAVASYAVEHAEGPVELRRYAPHIVAEVSAAGDRRTAVRAGFQVLADYIFGGNASGTAVDMTVPVTQSAADTSGDLWTVRFTMPAGFDVATLPEPDNAAIRFATLPEERRVVLRFSGRWLDATLASKEAELRAWAARHGLATRGPAIYAFYDTPFSAPWTRRNEVALALR